MKARTPRRAYWPGPVVMGLLAFGGCSSKTGDGGPTEKQGEDPSTVSLPASIFLLDDFESRSAALQGNSYVGSWYGYDDSSVQDATDPRKQFLEVAVVNPPHQTFSMKPPSAHALHARGGPYDGWGSGFVHPITDQVSTDRMPFDASAYEGLVFWAKKGTPDASDLLTVSLSTADDTSTEFGGRCMPRNNSSTGCGDAFHIDLALTDDWRVYGIPFTELHQAGFGYIPPNGFDKTSIFDVSFRNLQGTTYDELIDDVALYSNHATTTGAGGAGNDASVGIDASTGRGGSDSGVPICKVTSGPTGVTSQDIGICKAGLADAGLDDGGDAVRGACLACLCIRCPYEAKNCIGNPNCPAISTCCRALCKCPMDAPDATSAAPDATSAEGGD